MRRFRYVLVTLLLAGCPAGSIDSGNGGADARPASADASTLPGAPIVCATAGASADGGVVADPGPGPAQPRPFFPPASANLTRANALLADYDDAAWLALVPRQSPRGDPACPVAGQEGSAFTWDPHDPQRIKCAGGATTLDYDHPPQRVDVAVLSGRTVHLPAWPKPGGGLEYVGSRIDFEKSKFMENNLDLLAAAYVKTGDERYARRVALALDAWANTVPDYYLTAINDAAPITPAQAAARGWFVQRASDHNGIGHEMSWFPVPALDNIWDSQALVTLSAERGYDVREHIVKDLYLNETDWLTQTVPLANHSATNLSFSHEVMARLARVLGRRGGLIGFLDAYMARTVKNLMRDGMDGESFGYQRTYVVSNAKVVDYMAGYFDVWPPRDDAEAAIASGVGRSRALVHQGLDALVLVSLPDGQLPPFGDTGLDASPTARDASRTQLLPGYGHAALAAGAGDQQVQLDLGWEDNANHIHEDVLGFTLYAFARELIGDIRYSRVPGRAFTESTMAHNTVTVDRARQYRSSNVGGDLHGHLFTAGNLLTYEADLGGISLAEVDGANAYLNRATRYQRLMLLDAVDPAHPFVLDVFRVAGGATHDYFFHGSTRFDEIAESSLPLAPVAATYPLLLPGETWTEPTDSSSPSDWYGAFRDMRRARSSGDFSVTFREQGGTRGTRLTMLDDGARDVWVGRSPAPYRDTSPTGFYDHWRPTLLVRREGQDLDTAFVGVIEPFDGAPAIASVAFVPLATPDPDRFIVRVSFASGREDVLLVDMDAANPGQVASADGSYRLDGRFGVVTHADGSTRAVLVDGTRLEYPPGRSLTLAARELTGTIRGVVRQADACSVDAFVTDAELPEGDALRGRWIRLRFDRFPVVPDGTSYPLGIHEQRGITQMHRIERVQRQDGKSYIVLADDPMLTIDGDAAVETTRPLRRFAGEVTFSIALGAKTP
jgi:hypothetical protein